MSSVKFGYKIQNFKKFLSSKRGHDITPVTIGIITTPKCCSFCFRYNFRAIIQSGEFTTLASNGLVMASLRSKRFRACPSKKLKLPNKQKWQLVVT